MHEPEFENPYAEVPLWKGVLATVLFFFVFVGIPATINIISAEDKAKTAVDITDEDDLFTPASSTKPRRSPRNTNNLDCLVETA